MNVITNLIKLELASGSGFRPLVMLDYQLGTLEKTARNASLSIRYARKYSQDYSIIS